MATTDADLTSAEMTRQSSSEEGGPWASQGEALGHGSALGPAQRGGAVRKGGLHCGQGRNKNRGAWRRLTSGQMDDCAVKMQGGGGGGCPFILRLVKRATE
jgi:hypothetical protein